MKINKEQIKFLNKYTRGTWTLNEKTGLVDIEGNFDCDDEKLTNFKGVKFGVVTGYFSCSDNSLTSLVGAPQEVGEGFYCSDNNLTSLEGAPQKVGEGFYCSDNNLTSLEGAPQEVGGNFYCRYNKLTSLVGAPQKVGGHFNCERNMLTNLQGLISYHTYFYCGYNKVSKKTLDLVYETMKRKKVEYWEALCMLKDSIDEVSWNKTIVGLEDKITPEAIKIYSIISRYRNHFFN